MVDRWQRQKKMDGARQRSRMGAGGTGCKWPLHSATQILSRSHVCCHQRTSCTSQSAPQSQPQPIYKYAHRKQAWRNRHDTTPQFPATKRSYSFVQPGDGTYMLAPRREGRAVASTEPTPMHTRQAQHTGERRKHPLRHSHASEPQHADKQPLQTVRGHITSADTDCPEPSPDSTAVTQHSNQRQRVTMNVRGVRRHASTLAVVLTMKGRPRVHRTMSFQRQEQRTFWKSPWAYGPEKQQTTSKIGK